MAKKSKQMRAALEKIDSTKAYSVEEAVALAQETNFAKFDATVEVSYNLNIDVKKADQQIRGAMVLPNGTGKTQRVLVFARGAKAEEAKAAGADFVGEDELVAKINGGWLDFDVVVATPDMMAIVGRLGRVLGPRNLMPNPKTGTVTMDVAKAVESLTVLIKQVTYKLSSVKFHSKLKNWLKTSKHLTMQSKKLNQLQRKVLTSQTFQSLLHKVLVSKLILTHCKSSKKPIFG